MPIRERINLKLIPTAELIPHEETVPYLSDRLAHKMIRDGVQKDPIIVDEGSRIVLDGMHRLAALKRVGAKVAVCSLEDYMSEDLKLLRWHRFVEGPGEDVVRAARTALGTTKEVSFSWDEAGLQRGLTLTYLGKAYTSGREESAESVMEATRKFDRVVSESGAAIGYVDESTASPELLKGDYMALLAPRLRKTDVVRAAREGRLFPPKTTLHVLPVRPMGINYPIEDLRRNNDVLEKILSTRSRRRIEPPSFYRGRLYREPVVVLE